MTSTVMTGRRTKSSDRFIVGNLRFHHDLRTGPDAKLTLRNYLFAFLQTCRDDRVVAFSALDGDFAQFGGHVGLDHENVLAVGTGLHRPGWHDQGVFLVVELDPYVDELAWPERVLAVLELSPQLDGPGARVDRVIDEDQRSGGCGLIRARGQRLDREPPRGHVAANGAELLLRHGEVHVDRVHLVDHHEGKRVVRLDEVSHLNLDLSWVAIDRRTNRAVLQIERRVVDGGAAPLGHGLGGVGVGANLRVGLLGDEILGEQFLVAGLLGARLVLLRRIAQKVGFGLAQCSFVGSWVNLEQHPTARDFIAFLEADLHDLSVDARLDRHGGIGLDVADRQEPEWHDLLPNRRNRDGYRRRTFGRLALVRENLGAEIHEQQARNDEHADAAENKQALGRRCCNARSQ